MYRRRWRRILVAMALLSVANSLWAQGGGSTRVVEEFTGPWPSPSWAAGEEYIVIPPGELQNTETDLTWRHLVVYRDLPNAQVVSIVWGRYVEGTNSGSGAGAVAMGLNANTTTADGYAVLKREEGLELYRIQGGDFDGPPLDRVAQPIHATLPGAGDTTRVVFRNERNGYCFDVYVNGEYDGTLRDTRKVVPLSSTYYAGLVLFGLADGINNVGAVIVEKITDSTPPARVTDLQADAESPFSARLRWTAPADFGGVNRTAYGYDIRYSSVPIDAQNFTSATPAFGASEVVPAEPGATQEFVVYGLSPAATYYFALRSMDASGNVSQVSPSVSVSLPPKPDRWIYANDFSGPSLDADWSIPAGFELQNGELRNGGFEPALAVWFGETDPVRISLRWGGLVNQEGVRAGGLALMLDSPATRANGYLLAHQGDAVRLFAIEQGHVGAQALAEAPTRSGSIPGPGELIEVEILGDADGTHFLLYRNGVVDAVVHEPTGTRPAASQYYAGVVVAPGVAGAISEFAAEIRTNVPAALELVGGDGQADTVMSLLPRPLAVRVMGSQGVPVPGTMVDFRVAAGSGQLSIDSLAIDGHYFLEAEQAKARGAVLFVDDPAASRGKAAVNQGESRSYLDFPIYIGVPATYEVWIRYLAPNQSSNSLLGFQVDGGDTIRVGGQDWDLPLASSYSWAAASGLGLNLQRGPHSLRILFRDAGFRLDKLLLNRDPDYQPEGMGQSASSPSNLADENGVAWSRLTLGTTAGPVRVVAKIPGVDSLVFSEEAFPGPAAVLEIASGDGQHGLFGTTLPESLTVRVTDAYGNPVRGVRVVFAVEVGNGSVSPESAESDASGLARCLWTLGEDTTYQVVRATSPSVPGQVIRFVAEAGETTPTALLDVGGNGQSGVVNRPLPDSLKVRVLDNAGFPVPDHPVAFWIRSGGGTLNGEGREAQVRTNAQGVAAVQLVLPTAAGLVEVWAQSFWDGRPLQGSPVVFRATGLPDVPYRLVIYSGENQSGLAGEELPEPLVVQVQDQYGNGCQGHPVRFEVVNGGGTVNGHASTEVSTDEQGLASVRFALGPRAWILNKVQVSAQYQGTNLRGSPVYFEAMAVAGEASLVYVSGDSQRATVGTRLPEPLVVRVLDEMGNPAIGFQVAFEVKAGGGQLDHATVYTDSLGFARAWLTVGTVAGEFNQVVWASAEWAGSPLSGSPYVFRASALPDVASQLSKEGGDQQTGQVGTTLPQPFVVRVRDRYGNPVPDHPVLFEVVEGGGSFQGWPTAEVTTGNDGVARVFFSLGPTPGPNSNKVRARSWHGGVEIQGSPVEFVASSVVGEPRKLVEVSGNHQVGRAGTDLSQPFVAKVTDRLGNAISGYLVSLRVVAGGGSIGGATELDLATNARGEVQATLTLGPVAGVDNNVVEVVAPNLEGSPLRFVASALPGDPYELTKVSGDGQSAPAGLPLPWPFVVRVRDRFGNPVAGVPVTYVVVAGGGTFNGASVLQVVTDDSGRASALYTMGPQPGEGNNVVEARASFRGQQLIGSPVRFVCSGLLGPPARLVYVSGDSQVGVVNSPLLLPFKVRVTDAAGNVIEGHPVEFRVVAGGGTLDESGLPVATRFTNREGICQVRLRLGNVTGVNAHVVEARSYRSGQELDGSPVVFRASARASDAARLVCVSGNGQTGTVGKMLSLPLRVRVTDVYGNGVAAHPVTFRVTSGGGTLDGGQDALVVKATDSGGYAECWFTLGTRAGQNNHRVEALSSSGVGPLEGSPVVFMAGAGPDRPDPDSSSVWVERESAPADGQTAVGVIARLVDRFGNPTPGKAVTFEATGGGHQIQQPSSPSDANGEVRGSIVSVEAGVKTISARIVSDQIDVRRTAKVIFTALSAARIVLHSGNDQTRNAGTILAESLAVRIEDRNGNPVANYPVAFVLTKGNGRFLEPQPVRSNSEGIAAAHYVLSNRVGTDFVEARAEGLTGSPIVFRLNAVAGVPAVLQRISGDGQQGVVDQWAPHPLRVRVVDASGNPVWGVPVRYSVPTGGVAYPVVDSTDAWGIAEARFRYGRQSGMYQVLAEVTGIGNRASFTLQASPDQAARLVVISGAQQEGTVGLTLPQPIAVRVEDRFGNGVSGVPVSFRVVSGGGLLSATGPRPTDSQGLASVSWTLGTKAGNQLAKAEADELEGSPAFFMALARPGAPESLAAYSGNNQRGEAGKELSLPIEAIVLDRYGNGVPGIAVTFVSVDGRSQILGSEPVDTDQRGVASARWVLAPQPGPNTAWAIRVGLRGSPTEFRAVGENNRYPVILAPSDTAIREEQRIEFVVSAYDPDGGTVRLGVAGLPRGAYFDSLNTGRFSWTPDRASAGIYRIRFSARDDEGGVAYKFTTVRVKNQNRPPDIASFKPTTRTLAVTYPDTIRFSVSATDLDGDSVRFRWYVDRGSSRSLTSSTSAYLFVSQRHDPGSLAVECLVFDDEDTVKVSWQVTVFSAVELESFAAESVPFEGVRLVWRTARQNGVLGFNILRAEGEDSDYCLLNRALLPVREDRLYTYLDPSAEPGRVYFYRLEDVDASGRKTLHEPLRVSVTLPQRFVLHPNYPNPFNPLTRLRLEIPRAERVRVEIFDVRGRRVRVLEDRTLEPGYHELLWDGRDEAGTDMPSGVYYCRAVYGREVSVRKMLLLR